MLSMMIYLPIYRNSMTIIYTASGNNLRFLNPHPDPPPLGEGVFCSSPQRGEAGRGARTMIKAKNTGDPGIDRRSLL